MKKKIWILGIIMIVVFLVIPKRQKEYKNTYTITNQNQTFQIQEKYKNKQYLIEVENTFSFVIPSKKKNQKLIDSIQYYENDSYQCIYLIGKNIPKQDVLCHQKDTLYPYHIIKGVDSEIDQFVDSLEPYGYDKSQFEDLQKIKKTENGITLYDNLISNHILGIENYKGVTFLDQKGNLKEKNIFTNDQYQKGIEQFNQSYYLVADYNQEYEFHEFYLIHMETGKESKIISNQAISFDSYIQGIMDNKIYLLDRNHKKQYEIDSKKKTVKQIGDTDSGVQIYQTNWKTITMYQALKEEIYFNFPLEESITQKYEHCDRTTLYTYCYQKIGNNYQVYRYFNQAPKLRYFLTTIPDWKQVSYVEEYFYWKDDDKIYYYQDLVGTRAILSNSEFTFNPELLFGVYAK